VTDERKGQKNEALNLADFEIDDILSTSGERLLAEVGEDFGDPMFLAAEFDAIALPILSGDPIGRAAMVAAASDSAVAQAVSGVASWRAPEAALRSVPSSFRHVIRSVAERLAAPLRSRVVLGAVVTLLVAVLAPGIYPLLIKRIPTEQPASSLRNDLPGRAAPLAEQVVPRDKNPVEAGGADVVLPTPGTMPIRADQGTIHSPERFARTARPAPVQSAPPPSAPPMLQAAEPALPVQRPAPGQVAETPPQPAPPPPGQAQVAPAADAAASGSYLVQLAASKSESDAQSEFRRLQAKYSVLNSRQPVIRRKDLGDKGVVFVAAVGPFGAKGEADRVCGQIKAAGGRCYVYKD
jgi:cell division septation protein DedD